MKSQVMLSKAKLVRVGGLKAALSKAAGISKKQVAKTVEKDGEDEKQEVEKMLIYEDDAEHDTNF